MMQAKVLSDSLRTLVKLKVSRLLVNTILLFGMSDAVRSSSRKKSFDCWLLSSLLNDHLCFLFLQLTVLLFMLPSLMGPQIHGQIIRAA